MPVPEKVNYKYFGIAVVFLIMTYYFLTITQKSIHKKILEKEETSGVTVITEKGKVTLDPNIFEMHMKRIKENITYIKSNINTKKCSELKKYLKKAKLLTSEYLNANQDDLTIDFCNSNRMLFLNDETIKEKELLKKKFKTIVEHDASSDDEDDSDDEANKVKYMTIELLMDMDIILLLLKSSMCKNKTLNLNAIDQIVLDIYRMKCVDTESMENELDAETPPEVDHPSKYKRPKTKKETFIVSELPTHLTEREFESQYSNVGRSLVKSNYNKYMLEWKRDYDTSVLNPTIDVNCRTSLL
jgi:hypothetical protein